MNVSIYIIPFFTPNNIQQLLKTKQINVIKMTMCIKISWSRIYYWHYQQYNTKQVHCNCVKSDQNATLGLTEIVLTVKGVCIILVSTFLTSVWRHGHSLAEGGTRPVFVCGQVPLPVALISLLLERGQLIYSTSEGKPI